MGTSEKDRNNGSCSPGQHNPQTERHRDFILPNAQEKEEEDLPNEDEDDGSIWISISFLMFLASVVSFLGLGIQLYISG